MLLLPLLGVAPLEAALAPYANPIIFLFLGGFIIALTVERWGLHQRVALAIVAAGLGRGDRLIGGFMLATAALSMWVSNTATTMMLLPVALSLIALVEGRSDLDSGADTKFARALLLSIAYGASIGGLATLIGTPPNAFLAGFMSQSYGVEMGFFQWMVFAFPLSVFLLLLTWLLLSRGLFQMQRLDLGFLATEMTERPPRTRSPRSWRKTECVSALNRGGCLDLPPALG